MVDLDLPTVEVDLEELSHRPLDHRRQQVSGPTVIVTAAEPFAIASRSDHQQPQCALAGSALPVNSADFFVLHLAAFSAIEDFGGFPGSGRVQPDLFGSKLLRGTWERADRADRRPAESALRFCAIACHRWPHQCNGRDTREGLSGGWG